LFYSTDILFLNIEAQEQESISKDISGFIKASTEETKEIFSGDEGFVSERKDYLKIMQLLQYRVLVENPMATELHTALQTSSHSKRAVPHHLLQPKPWI
jgi:hypothetical protein